MDLTLTPDVENALAEKAVLQGTTPEKLALDTLRKAFVGDEPEQNVTQQKPQPLLVFLKGFIGVLHSSEMPDKETVTSENTGNAFTQLLVNKRKQGHL